MATVLKRPQAEADLEEIWEYIAQGSLDAADRVLNEIEDRCNTLAQFPMLGTRREELLPSLRSLAVGNYVMFYLPIEGGIEVVRVLHGRRDIAAFF